MHQKEHEFRVQWEVLVQRVDSGMFLVLSSRYGARRQILESVPSAHLILYVEKLDLHLQNFICTVDVFSDSEGICFRLSYLKRKREFDP